MVNLKCKKIMQAKHWLNTEYTDIAKRAIKENVQIQWGDETGLCDDSYHGSSYAPPGETFAIRISDHQQSWRYEDGPWKGPGPPCGLPLIFKKNFLSLFYRICRF